MGSSYFSKQKLYKGLWLCKKLVKQWLKKLQETISEDINNPTFVLSVPGSLERRHSPRWISSVSRLSLLDSLFIITMNRRNILHESSLTTLKEENLFDGVEQVSLWY